MDILNTLTLKSNRHIKINFDGGDLSSDAGLLLIKEFAAKIGFAKLIKKKSKTNDKSIRFHKDDENLMQMIYQIISAYFEDDCADELTLAPVFNAILEKDALASQPTLSRFFNRMNEDALILFDDIDKSLRDIIYSIKCPEHMLLDLDSTLFGTYGNQEGGGFNFHYQAHGYHPLLCYDGLTGDLLKAELRDGTLHSSNDADKFMESLFQEYLERGIKTYLRGDSGFSTPRLYKTCEMNGCSYAIRLKQNSSLITLASDKEEDLYKATIRRPYASPHSPSVPRRIPSPCPRCSSRYSRLSFTAFGLPGRLIISVCPRIPETARLNITNKIVYVILKI